MALLHGIRDDRWANLGMRCLVGRYPNCDLQLLDPLVSGHHATLLFQNQGWTIHPQATRNGTVMDGTALVPGKRYPLNEGALIEFGTVNQTWCLVDASPPGPAMIPNDGEAVALRARPWISADGRVSVVFEDPRCTIRNGAESRLLIDREVIVADGTSWTLHVPSSASEDPGRTQTDHEEFVQLGFVVSPDGDRIHRCVLVLGRKSHELRVRRHTHLLLDLAEARLAEPEGGWVLVPHVQRRLRISMRQLYTYTHRAQVQLVEAGLPSTCTAVEKRGERGARELRLGVAATLRSGSAITERRG